MKSVFFSFLSLMLSVTAILSSCASAAADESLSPSLYKPSQLPVQDNPAELKVMSFNIKACAGLTGGGSCERIAAVINQTAPDIVFLQEVDLDVRRSGRINQPQQLADLTGMYCAFAPSIRLDTGFYGTALLSRFPLSDADIIRLPGRPGMEKRASIVAAASLPDGKQLILSSVHLSYEAEKIRIRQAQELAARLLERSAAAEGLIFGGDFNDVPGSRTIGLLNEQFAEALPASALPTSPSDSPQHQIDFIFCGKGHLPGSLKGIELDPQASDHLPVFTRIRLNL